MRHNLTKVAGQDLLLIHSIKDTESIPHSKYILAQTFTSILLLNFNNCIVLNVHHIMVQGKKKEYDTNCSVCESNGNDSKIDDFNIVLYQF